MNNWYQLQNASFRGVPFLYRDIGGTSGRRAITHEYPKREKGWTEDNGAKLAQFSVNAYLIGDDYRDKLDALLAALNTVGAGRLVHPHFGEINIQIGDVSHKFVDTDGGYIVVTFECFDAGIELEPEVSVDTQVVLNNSVDECANGLNEEFTKSWLSGIDTSSITGVVSDIGKYVDDIAKVANEAIDDVSGLVDVAESTINLGSNILATPGQLAMRVTGLIERVFSLATTMPMALKVYDKLEKRWRGHKYEYLEKRRKTPSAVTDSSLEKERKNRDLLSHLMLTSLSIRSAQVVSKITFTNGDANDSYRIDGGFTDAKQAQAITANINTQLQENAITASDLGHRNTFINLRVVARQLQEDVNKRALLMPNIRTVTTSKTLPVALIAYQETGDTRNRNQIIQRNRIAHPSFIERNSTLELLND